MCEEYSLLINYQILFINISSYILHKANFYAKNYLSLLIDLQDWLLYILSRRWRSYRSRQSQLSGNFSRVFQKWHFPTCAVSRMIDSFLETPLSLRDKNEWKIYIMFAVNANWRHAGVLDRALQYRIVNSSRYFSFFSRCSSLFLLPLSLLSCLIIRRYASSRRLSSPPLVATRLR